VPAVESAVLCAAAKTADAATLLASEVEAIATSRGEGPASSHFGWDFARSRPSGGAAGRVRVRAVRFYPRLMRHIPARYST
jgi:hypothetical protein